MIESPLALATFLISMLAIAFWIEGRFSWGQKVGASLLIIAFGAAASNAGVVPATSPLYDVLSGPVTSLAIVWLLLGLRLEALRAAGPTMLLAFSLAVAATAVGAIVATLAFATSFPDEGWKLAGVMTGTYSGGSLNFVTVGRALELPESLFAAATAADNVLTSLWMAATLMLPIWLARFYRPRRPVARTTAAPQHFDRQELQRTDLAILLAIGMFVVWIAEAASDWLPGPSVIWLTTAAIAVGQLAVVRRLKGSLLLGGLALNLFFVVIGIGSRIAQILEVGIGILYLTMTVVVVHGIVVFAVGRLLRIDVETLAVASQAAIGGPSTALALTSARRWHDLSLPGTAVGLLGYAVGSYAGLAIAFLMRRLLGG